MTSAAMAALQDGIDKGRQGDAGEIRLSLSTLQVVLASVAMCTDESLLAITRAARQEVVRPGGDWIVDADNIDAHFSSHWQQQQQKQQQQKQKQKHHHEQQHLPISFDLGLTRCVHFMADLERPQGKKRCAEVL